MTNPIAPAMPADPLAKHTATPRELKAVLMAERRGTPFLAYRDDTGSLLIVSLPARHEPLLLGRSEAVDIQLHWDPQVSGLHAELTWLGAEWTIADEDLSRNGTFVNARKITGRCRLREGDRITVGTTAITFRAPSAPTIAPTAAGSVNELIADLSETQRRILLALCRPKLSGGDLHAPATNQEIATEVCLSVDTVKAQLRAMFARHGLDGLPQNQKRAALAELALRTGAVASRDL